MVKPPHEPFDPHLDPLFSVPFSRFTEARDSLAKALRGMGDKAAAAVIAKTKRPTRSAWALNQVARRHPEAIRAFLAATARDRDAQTKGVASRDAAAIRDAGRAMNDSVARIVALASKEITDDGGADVSAAMGRVIAGTLRAVPFASDDDVARFTAGRLVTDLEAPDDFALFGAVPANESDVARDEPKPAKRHAAEPAADAKKQAKEREAEKAAERARAERARVEAERKRRVLEKLEEAAKEAEREATRLERVATTAEEHAQQARRDADAARAEARRAREAVSAKTRD